MTGNTPNTVYLKDYKKPDYLIPNIHLTFDLDDTKTQVTSILKVKKNYDEGIEKPLVLNGENLTLKSIKVNGESLSNAEYELTDSFLTIKKVGDNFTVEIENEINPEANKALDGLYKSGSIFCTQNEPEGFRRITYYPDRPDVMAKFTTKVIADKKLYPTLLSNGNPIGNGDVDGNKHWMEWEDPFPKPSYLFALVAGDLGLVRDSFTTVSGREIDLRIYCDKGNEDKCDHAMESLKKSMTWDEEKFGLEYDLDIYMIVAVDSFNMGAMENKGLNIFNSAYVLAKQETATDSNFLGVEGVVGHEYFHNWTGNRITCRDWFQLTLKEGLTVFRDQEFSGDMNSKAVQRISDVQGLRSHQFVEDSGPTAHPIKPESYIEINNFYTSTIYEKGSEIIRMIHTFLGPEQFRKGIDKYFELYDGQAVRTEDFLNSMSLASGFDFTQFKNWYSQAGTPEVDVKYSYDKSAKILKLNVEQSCAATPECSEKKAFHFPLRVGLISKNGKEILDTCLNISKKSEEFSFDGIEEMPVISVNRGFSAPVKLTTPNSFEDLIFLMANDSDEFNRFEAASLLGKKIINELIVDHRAGKELELNESYINAYKKLLMDSSIDNSFKALSMSLPSSTILFQEQNPIDFDTTHFIREFVKKTLATECKDILVEIYKSLNDEKGYDLSPESIGKRTLKNTCLIMLMATESSDIEDICNNQFKTATNMTDELAALQALVNSESKYSEEALNAFYKKWDTDKLVMQKWIGTQSSALIGNVLDTVKKLEKDPVYDISIPNFVRALLGFFTGNYVNFHNKSGEGYKFISEKILEMDKLNPQVASGLANSFKIYKKLDSTRQGFVKTYLTKVRDTEGLSKNTYEIVSKILS